MRSLLCVLAALAVSVSATRDEMIETNKILPIDAVDNLGDACSECKTIIHEVVAVIDDPQKLAELKIVLGALCHETSYVEECKMFVNKIDIFIKRLEPFLRDPETICKKIRLCGNSRLDFFHRVGLLYIKKGLAKINGKNDFVCDECQLAAIEFKKYVDDAAQRKEIQQFISENICKRIPKYSGTCDLMVEQFLPELFEELDNLLQNPKTACATLGFCDAQLALANNKPQHTPKRSPFGFWRRSQHLNTKKGSVLISCFECKIAIDTLIYDLRTLEHIASISNDIRELVCPRLPAHIVDGCEDFLKMYMPTVVLMTLEQLDSESLCKAFKMCDTASARAMASLAQEDMESMKCEGCKAFSAFMEYEVTQPDFKADLVSGFRSYICTETRMFSQLCENLSETYVPRVVDKLVKIFSAQGGFCTDMTHAC